MGNELPPYCHANPCRWIRRQPFSVVWAEKVVPPAKAEYERIIQQEIKNNTKPRTQDHILLKNISKGQLTRLTYARTFDEKAGVMKDITIEDWDKGRVVRIQRTPEAKWQNGTWIMEKGTITEITNEEGLTRTMTFDKQVLPITETPKTITLDQKDPDEMTIGELKMYIGILERQYQPTSKYVMEIYSRFTVPLASFFFALIGVPLGVQSQRAGTSMGLGFSVVIIFIYYSIMTFMTGLGQGGVIPPFIAAAVPNFLCGCAGAYLIWQKDH